MNLKLDWCTHEAALYACKHWHYSKCMPAGKNVKIGVWEFGKYIGCVIYALGANASISKLKGKTCELARVALKDHKTPVTRIIAISIKLLKVKCPSLDAIVSYADLDRHEGIIYKAGNWIDEGVTIAEWVKLKGQVIHPRSVNAKYGTCSLPWLKKNVDKNVCKVKTKGKRRFIMYLNKRAPSKDSVVPGDQLGEGGASPTGALHVTLEDMAMGSKVS